MNNLENNMLNESVENEGRKDQTPIEEYIDRIDRLISDQFDISKVDNEEATYSIRVRDLVFDPNKMPHIHIDDVDLHVYTDDLGKFFIDVFVDGITYMEQQEIDSNKLLRLHSFWAIFKGYAEMHGIVRG